MEANEKKNSENNVTPENCSNPVPPVEQNVYNPQYNAFPPNVKTKKCRYCKCEMIKNARVCPTCRKNQGEISTPIFIIGAIVIGFFVVMCIYINVTSKSKNNISSSTIKPSSTTKPVTVVTNYSPDATTAPKTENSTVATTKQPEEIVPTVAQNVLYNKDGIKITANGLGQNYLGTTVKLLIENNSDDDIMVQTKKSSINGYMVDAMFSSTVSKGKKVNDEITFTKSKLEEIGIKQIADIEFAFSICNADNWLDSKDTELISIKTSIADTYKYTFDTKGDVIYEKNGIRIITKGLGKDSFLGKRMILMIENLTDENITVQTRDVSINGYMVTDICSIDVVASKRALDSMTFAKRSLDENGITKINDVEMKLYIFNKDSWAEIDESDIIKVSFN